MKHDKPKRRVPFGPRRREALVRDILTAEHDLVTLLSTHDLEPRQVADWIAETDNRQLLLRLCALADIQTQLLLSRYRAVAADRLLRLATLEQGDAKEAEIARRACVDLIRLDLKRAEESSAQPDHDELTASLDALSQLGDEDDLEHEARP